MNSDSYNLSSIHKLMPSTVMAFIHLAARTSLRDGLRCLTASGKRLYHLGLRTVARSTVTDADRGRPAAFFKELFERMHQRCSNKAPGRRLRFNAKLFSLDSSTVSLWLSVFPWAAFSRGKAGIKMHTVWDHDGHIPAFVDLPKAKVYDSQVSKILGFFKGPCFLNPSVGKVKSLKLFEISRPGAPRKRRRLKCG